MNYPPQTNVDDIGDDDIEDEEDEMDGDIIDYESTDSMTSANQLNAGYTLAPKTEIEQKSPFQVKRLSTTSNTIFYNAKPCLSHQNNQQVLDIGIKNDNAARVIPQGPAVSVPPAPAQSLVSRFVLCPRILTESLSSLADLPSSTLVLVTLVLVLLVLFLFTCNLFIRLEDLQRRVESPLLRSSQTTIEQLVGWQNLLNSHSSKKIQEYLDLNLQQIARVRFIMKLPEFC